jgi:hypothetical protein
MCFNAALVFPNFSTDGKRLVSLSGPSWVGLDTVRVWDVSLERPRMDTSKIRFTGKKAPPWLADLADAVSGLKVVTEDDDTPPVILSDVRKQVAQDAIPKEYAPVWNRFFANGGQ